MNNNHRITNPNIHSALKEIPPDDNSNHESHEIHMLSTLRPQRIASMQEPRLFFVQSFSTISYLTASTKPLSLILRYSQNKASAGWGCKIQ